MQYARSPEGWPLVDMERRCEDPWVFDDCWHRGPYVLYTLRGTHLSADNLNALVRTMEHCGVTGTFELVGTGLPYRRILDTGEGRH